MAPRNHLCPAWTPAIADGVYNVLRNKFVDKTTTTATTSVIRRVSGTQTAAGSTSSIDY